VSTRPRIFLVSPGHYEGKDGEFEYEDGVRIEVDAFVADGIEAGGCRVEAQVRHGERVFNADLNGRLVARFCGRTVDGYSVTAENVVELETVGPIGVGVSASVAFRFDRLLIAAPDSTSGSDGFQVQVQLLNLLFNGNLATEYELDTDGHPAVGDAVARRESRHDRIHFTVAGRDVAIVQALKYLSQSKMLRKGERITAPTAQLSIVAASRDDFDPTMVVVQRITELLTLASGTHVAWCAAYMFDRASGVCVNSERRAPIVRPYSGRPSVDRSASSGGVV
jgi:hypothetical protein